MTCKISRVTYKYLLGCPERFSQKGQLKLSTSNNFKAYQDLKSDTKEKCVLPLTHIVRSISLFNELVQEPDH